MLPLSWGSAVLIAVTIALSSSGVVRGQSTPSEWCFADSSPPTPPFDPFWRAPELCKGSRVSRAEAAAAAWKFAPIIRFHPLEKYYPNDVVDFLQRASLFDANQVSRGKVTEINLLENSRSSRESELLYITTGSNQSWPGEDQMKGAPFNENGESTAPVYFRLLFNHTTQAWVYNYIVFYDFNGCGDLQLLYEEEGGSVQTSLEIVACSFGAHEGDWEHVSVEVCRDLSAVRRVSYSEHSWNLQLNCSATYNHSSTPQCQGIFEEGTWHPRAFAALNSHASYPFRSRWNYLYQFQVGEIPNLLAASIVDRGLSGGTQDEKLWRPKENNGNLVELDANGTLSTARYWIDKKMANYSAPDWSQGPSWEVFLGRWGLSYNQFFPTLTNMSCVFDNATRIGQCPNNGFTEVAYTLLSLEGGLNTHWIAHLLKSEGKLITPYGPQGPRLKPWYLHSQGPVASPMAGQVPVCADPAIYQPYWTGPEPLPPRSASWTIAVVTGVFAVLMSMSFLFFAGAGGQMKRSTSSDDLHTLSSTTDAAHMLTPGGTRHAARLKDAIPRSRYECGMTCKDMMVSLPRTSTLGMVLIVGGTITATDGLDKMFHAFNDYLPSEVWRRGERLINAWSPWIIVFSTVALLTSFFTHGKTFEYFCLHSAARCHTAMARYGWTLQIWVVILLVFSAGINLILVAFSGIVWALHRAFLFVCERSANRVTGVCLSLQDFGWDAVYCGDQINHFCYDMRSVHPIKIVVGNCIVHVGILFMAMSAYKAFNRMRKFARYHQAYSLATSGLDSSRSYSSGGMTSRSHYKGNGRRALLAVDEGTGSINNSPTYNPMVEPATIIAVPARDDLGHAGLGRSHAAHSPDALSPATSPRTGARVGVGVGHSSDDEKSSTGNESYEQPFTVRVGANGSVAEYHMLSPSASQISLDHEFDEYPDQHARSVSASFVRSKSREATPQYGPLDDPTSAAVSTGPGGRLQAPVQVPKLDL